MNPITVTLQNATAPERGKVNIELPSDEEQLDTALLSIGISAGIERNCKLTLPDGISTPLNTLKDSLVNPDELNYLAMRLDSFDSYEMLKFQAAAACDGIADMTGLINLTFNINDYTVVDNFSDYEAIGKRYYFDEHLACMESDINNISFAAIGLNLFNRQDGVVTPFGVVFKHGKMQEILYDGLLFPGYNYSCDNELTVGLTTVDDPYAERLAWLYLPVPDSSLKKAALRLGIDSVDDLFISDVQPDNIDGDIWTRLDIENETIQSLNGLCRALHGMDSVNVYKLNAVCDFAGAVTADEISVIAGILDRFDYYPEVRNAEQYGQYFIKDSGHFSYDENLDEYYDYKRYGEERMSRESGMFLDCGYVVYDGSPEELNELLRRGPEQNTGLTLS